MTQLCQQPLCPLDNARISEYDNENEKSLPQNSPGFPDITESLCPSFSLTLFAFFLTGPSFCSGLFLLLSISATYTGELENDVLSLNSKHDVFEII